MRESLPRMLGGIVREIDSLKQGMTEPGDMPSMFLLLRGRFKPKITKILLEERTIGTAFIIGHTDNAVLGTSTLGAGTMGSYSTVETITPNQGFTIIGKNEIRDWLVNNTSYHASLITVGNDDTVFGINQKQLSKKTYEKASTNTTASKKITMVITLPSTIADGSLVTDSIKEVGVEGNV